MVVGMRMPVDRVAIEAHARCQPIQTSFVGVLFVCTGNRFESCTASNNFGFSKSGLGLAGFDLRSKGLPDVHRFKPVSSECCLYAQAIGLQQSQFLKRILGFCTLLFETVPDRIRTIFGPYSEEIRTYVGPKLAESSRGF